MARLFRATLLALALGACGTSTPAVEDDETPEAVVAESTAVGEAQALTFRPVWVHVSRIDFPHGPHRRLECRECHASLPNHATHGRVECTDCHPVPQEAVRAPVPSQTECLTCHHVRQGAVPCATCHEPGEVAGERTVSTPVRMAAWDAPRPRDLTFDHQWHDTLTCNACHEASITNAPVTECRSCHESHHVADAVCARCHQPAQQGVHGDAVHQGCGGAGCHANQVVLRLPPSRPLCASCHPAQVDHEPGGDCASCHGIAEAWRGGRGP